MRQQQRVVGPAYDWEPRRQAPQLARSPRRRRPRRRLRRPALLLLLFCAASAVAGMHSSRERLPAPPAAPAPAVSPAAPVNPFGRGRVNILVVGIDAGEPKPGPTAGRTDTILLVTADLEHQGLGLLSIPSDTLVELPGHGPRKINAAWSLGGVALAAQAVANVTRQQVDHFLRLDLAGLEELVEAIGGVNLEVEQRMHYVDRAQGLRIDLQPGRQLLSGAEAMQYVRFRSDAEGDLGRIRRQQRFLRALAASAVDGEKPQRLPAVIASLGRHLETTLTPVQVARLVQLLGRLEPSQIAASRLPGRAGTVDGTRYFVADADAGTVAGERSAASLPATALKPLVTIYNGSDRLGLEKVVAASLAASGYRATPAARAVVSQRARTRIYGVTARHQAAARQIAAVLGLTADPGPAPAGYPPVTAGPGTAPVVVVLGVDFPR